MGERTLPTGIEGRAMSDLPIPAPPDGPPYDCLVLSDLHLGSDVCQARLLEEFLEWASAHTRMLVINGDIFDDLNFKRLTRRHFAFDNGQIRLMIFHGDQFDHFITRYKWITAAACKLFYGIQRWFPHRASRWIRRVSKKWQRNSELVERTAVEYARSKGCRHVTCGHTHLPLVAVVDGVSYFNTGTWTDHPPCPFLSVRGAEVRLESWPRPAEATPAEGDIAQPLGEALR
jgi:UDP-2,3-diacylglucosamine pyrophosphatase LpxH